MAIMSRFVLPQQGRCEQSQKQQDDYASRNSLRLWSRSATELHTPGWM